MKNEERVSGWQTTRAPALLSALLGVLVFAPTLAGTFIFDDVSLISDNPRIADPSRWGEIWTRSYNGSIDNLYRPLVSMTYAVQWQLHGETAWPYHLLNVLLHGAVCACVAGFTRRLIGFKASLITGLLFAVHPIHVEAVANIVGRAEMMCALGIFGALLLFLKPLTPWRAGGIGGCFLLALLSKEQGMLLAPMLLVLGLLRRPIPGSRPGLLVLTLLICWILAAYIVWRETILPFWWDRQLIDPTINPLVQSVGLDRWLMPTALLGRYVSLLLVPIELSIDYGTQIIGSRAHISDPYLWLGMIALVCWCVLLALAIRERSPTVLFALIGLGLTYTMVSNAPVLIGTIFGERLMYIPSAFLLMLIAIPISQLPRHALTAVLGVAVMLGAVRCFAYERHWNNRLDFYQWSLSQQPGSIKLRMMLADELLQQGQLDRAASANSDARALFPGYWDLWVQAAQIAIARNEFDQAEAYLRHASKITVNSRIVGWSAELTKRRAATRPTTQ